jgi:hypothetical protein
VQLLHSARERLIKRLRAEFSLVEALSSDSSIENDTLSSKPRRKRARKTAQPPQFSFYQDTNSVADRLNLCGSKSQNLDLIGRQTEKI